VPVDTCPLQGRQAIAGLCVDVSAILQQQLRSFTVVVDDGIVKSS
jgi:hypothetical protein